MLDSTVFYDMLVALVALCHLFKIKSIIIIISSSSIISNIVQQCKYNEQCQ